MTINTGGIGSGGSPAFIDPSKVEADKKRALADKAAAVAAMRALGVSEASPPQSPSAVMATPSVPPPAPFPGAGKPLAAMNPSQLWSRLEADTKAWVARSSEGDLLPTVYEDIVCPSDTAVKYEGKPYVHYLYNIANVIGHGVSARMFVASMEPSEYKTDFVPFWRSVIKESAGVVIDLRMERAAHDYVSPPYAYKGEVDVKRKAAEDDVQVYTVVDKATQESERKLQESQEVRRFHFKAWPDHGVVSVKDLSVLVDRMEGFFARMDAKRKIWVHCRAGVGRTGTLITAFYLKEKIKAGDITRDNLNGKLVDLVFTLRKQRANIFVQRVEQFELLLDYAQSLFPH